MYRYAIEYRDEANERLGAVPVEPDWEPALECTLFEAIRRGLVAPSLAPRPAPHAPRVEPVFHDELGPPVLSGARVVVPVPEGEAFCEEIPNLRGFLRDLARDGSSTLVESGVLVAGQKYHYEVCAFPIADAHPSAVAAAGFELETVEDALVFAERALPGAPDDPARCVGSPARDGEMRVFVPADVLAEVVEAARATEGVEVGGFLLGTLSRDPASTEIFLEVTAQTPARHTDATSASLTFTAETWADAHAVVALRRRDEILCGWWHLHPHFCHRCPEERRAHCAFSRAFFSATDVHMHRTVFPRPYHVALLASDLGGEELDLRLFGWHRGTVAGRAFEVVERAR